MREKLGGGGFELGAIALMVASILSGCAAEPETPAEKLLVKAGVLGNADLPLEPTMVDGVSTTMTQRVDKVVIYTESTHDSQESPALVLVRAVAPHEETAGPEDNIIRLERSPYGVVQKAPDLETKDQAYERFLKRWRQENISRGQKAFPIPPGMPM